MSWASDFVCPGGDCGLTCCSSEWKINLIDSEIEEYKKIPGELGEMVREAVDFENKCLKCNGDKCALLDERGYCKMVYMGSEDLLSYTCSVFPRIEKKYGSFSEILVEILCPVVAKTMIEGTPIEWFEFTDDEGAELDSDDEYENTELLRYVRENVAEVINYKPGQYSAGKCYIVQNIFIKLRELVDTGRLNIDEVNNLLSEYAGIERIESIFNQCEQIDKMYSLKATEISRYLQLNDGEYVDLILKEAYKEFTEIEGILHKWRDNPSLLTEVIDSYYGYIKKTYPLFAERYLSYLIVVGWINEKGVKFGERFLLRNVEKMLIDLCAMALFSQTGEVDERDMSVIVASIDRVMGRANSDAIEKLHKVLFSDIAPNDLVMKQMLLYVV